MVEFIRHFDSGYGNYTKERHKWFDGLTIGDISNKIKNEKYKIKIVKLFVTGLYAHASHSHASIRQIVRCHKPTFCFIGGLQHRIQPNVMCNIP
jgi:hypothetical protein